MPYETLPRIEEGGRLGGAPTADFEPGQGSRLGKHPHQMPFFRVIDPAGPVLERLRKLCLALPETSEVVSWGHPSFRAGKRTFVTFETFGGRPSIAFRLNATDIGPLLRRRQFFITPYGRGQWVSLRADGRINWSVVGDLAERSYRVVALKRMASAVERKRRASRGEKGGRFKI